MVCSGKMESGDSIEGGWCVEGRWTLHFLRRSSTPDNIVYIGRTTGPTREHTQTHTQTVAYCICTSLNVVPYRVSNTTYSNRKCLSLFPSWDKPNPLHSLNQFSSLMDTRRGVELGLMAESPICGKSLCL